jgi:hypothetical protein
MFVFPVFDVCDVYTPETSSAALCATTIFQICTKAYKAHGNMVWQRKGRVNWFISFARGFVLQLSKDTNSNSLCPCISVKKGVTSAKIFDVIDRKEPLREMATAKSQSIVTKFEHILLSSVLQKMPTQSVSIIRSSIVNSNPSDFCI